MRRSSKTVPTSQATPTHGRGSGVPHPIDVHVGTHVRLRRLLRGMNQKTLSKVLGLTFQQVQQYERGNTRISASRLSAIAAALGVPVAYFFAELEPSETALSPAEQCWREQRQWRETISLIRHYYGIADPKIRHRFLVMVKTAANPGPGSEIGAAGSSPIGSAHRDDPHPSRNRVTGRRRRSVILVPP